MSNDLKFYINGEWVQSDSNELIDVINPANEEIIGQVTAGTKEDIDSAVNAASEAFISFSKSTQQERIELLQSIIKEYEIRYKDFAEVGNSNIETDSSFLRSFKRFLETFTAVSKPTTSIVLNVADFGLPIKVPVKKSTSETLRLFFSTECMVDIKE